MRFKINFVNHPDLTSLEDFRVLLRLLVESAGHQAEYDERPPTSGFCHIFLEGFTPDYADMLRAIKQAGSESIIVATEYVGKEGFNDFAEQEGTVPAYKDFVCLLARPLPGLQGLRRHARAIWCASADPRQIVRYQTLVEDVPVVPLPFPHFPAYPRIVHRAEKDIDVFFSGRLTPYRLSLMWWLSQRLPAFR